VLCPLEVGVAVERPRGLAPHRALGVTDRDARKLGPGASPALGKAPPTNVRESRAIARGDL